MLIKELAQDEAIAEADTLLLTVPNQLGVEYNAHVIEVYPEACRACPWLAVTARERACRDLRRAEGVW